jgi:hypothetical protein
VFHDAKKTERQFDDVVQVHLRRCWRGTCDHSASGRWIDLRRLRSEARGEVQCKFKLKPAFSDAPSQEGLGLTEAVPDRVVV